MKLIELELAHFRGIKSFRIKPEGQSLEIRGDNRTGKSTLAHAFSWLMTDKDMENRTAMAFGIKYAPGGVVEHGLDYGVRGVFEMNGKPTELEKIYRENWVRSRGKVDRELKSHYTVYKINGDEVKQNEYNDFIEKQISSEVFKILSNPLYFSLYTHWQDREGVLFDMIGKVTDLDILSMNEKYDPLRKELNEGETVEQVNERLSKRRREWMNQIKEIPVRIDTLEKQVSEVRDMADVKKELVALNEQVDEKTSQLASLKTDDDEAKIKSQIRQVEQEKQTRKNELENKKFEERVPEARDLVNHYSEEIDSIQERIKKRRNEISKLDAKGSQDRILHLEKLIEAEKKKEPDTFKRPGACPTCGQDWPDEVVSAKKKDHEKHVKDFNKQRSEKLKKWNQEIKSEKRKLVDIDIFTKTYEKEIHELELGLDEATGMLKNARDELMFALNEKPDLLSDDEYVSLVEREQELNSKLGKVDTSAIQEKQKIESEISGLKESVSELLTELSEIKSQEKIRNSIEEFKQERSELDGKLATVEKILFLIEDFIIEKAEYITERVNDKFDLVRWKLFEHQVNGGINDRMCEAMLHGAEFAHLSTSEKIIAGLDIIRSLSRHYDHEVPVFIDNRESITALPVDDLQIISLLVDVKYNELKVEMA